MAVRVVLAPRHDSSLLGRSLRRGGGEGKMGVGGRLRGTCTCALSRTDPDALAFAKCSLTFEAVDCAMAIPAMLSLCRTRSRTLLERVKPAIYIKILTERVRTRCKIEQVDSQ